MADLKAGDTIKRKNWSDLRETCEDLAKEGYKVEVRGWDGMRNNKITVVSAPGEVIHPIIKTIEEVREEMCNSYCKYSNGPIPEGKDADWLFEDPDSPCMNCPLDRL